MEQMEVTEFVSLVDNTDANSLESIQKLERKMKSTTPEVKFRVSSYIERGKIANKVKQINNYKCQICEATGKDPFTFKKSNGPFI